MKRSRTATRAQATTKTVRGELAAAERWAETAASAAKSAKVEFKRIRKAYRQARKNAKQARKEVKALKKQLKSVKAAASAERRSRKVTAARPRAATAKRPATVRPARDIARASAPELPEVKPETPSPGGDVPAEAGVGVGSENRPG